ncbi:MAG TPA: gliding motility-associated C-terminal domain-containing protein, partial [Brumimicrobium sp.]|nr:gliding motility-associated C-terminal domain-containing protein [Brumimicrobium sp.]
TIDGTIELCENDSEPQITFTGSNGTSPYIFTYTVNGGANQTVTTTSGNSIAVDVPTTNSGTFTYDLIAVEDNSSTQCSNNQTGTATVTINPLPEAEITGSVDVCREDTEPQITFTGSNGTAPYIFTYTINGGHIHTVTTTTGNSVDVSVPTNTPGTFIYDLIAVEDNSSTRCSDNQSGFATVTVYPLPIASMSGSTEVCENDIEPQITFTGSNGTAPYTFTYTINGGPQQTVTTTSGNTVTINVPTNVVNSFVYELISIEDSSPVNCMDKPNGEIVTIVVDPLPTGFFTYPNEVCQFDEAVLEFEGENSLDEYKFTFNVNGGVHQFITTEGSNSVHLNTSTQVPGSYNYELISVEDPSTGCVNLINTTGTIEVIAQPVARFYTDPEELISYEWEAEMVNESTNAAVYHWEFGYGNTTSSEFSPSHEFPNDKSASYVIMLVAATADYFCIDTAYRVLNYKDELLFFIPNAFTPNGDERNNTFLPVFSAGYDPGDYTLQIYNRWGELIFESRNADIGWDGTFNGKIAQEGTYVWRIEVQKSQTETRELFNGNITLLR